jgi:signal transduction histidine kinase
VVVTAAAVLVVEAVLLGFYVPSILSSSDLQSHLQVRADQDAKVLSLTASKITVDHPDLGVAELLNAAQKMIDQRRPVDQPPDAGDGGVPIKVIKGITSDKPIEALVDLAGRIVTSSAAAIYPAGDSLDVPLPGKGGGQAKTRTGNTIWWLSPVLLSAPGDAAYGQLPYKITGYVYVQAPADYRVTDDASGSMLVLIGTTGVLVLALVVPVGLIFGLLSTRRLIGRLRRLAEVTGTVAQGDFRPRVEVSGTDEVSRLEDSFNTMAERLESALDAERAAGQAEARQAERARIARELHDSISQDLFSLSLLAAGMRRAAPDRLRREAESMEHSATRAMREMQALLLELRPVALEDAGLGPAIEELCRAYEARLGLRVDTLLEEVPLGLSTEHAVLRLVQEALSNAIKHAEPELVEVRLLREASAVRVEIHDDGAGFDASAVAARHGMGLRLMRERVEELGGTFDLRTSPGKGTMVGATFEGTP